MSQLISALGKDVKSSGKNTWMAKCPVHKDADFAMRIRLQSNNSYTITCYACGVNGVDVYKHMGLDLDELFGGRKNNSTPQHVKDQYQEDRFFIEVYKSDVARGVRPIYQDTKRMKLATARMEGARTKYGIV